MTTETAIQTAKEIVAAYEKLLARAVEIVSDVPFYHCIDDDESITLTFDGDEAVLSWSSYESDYYGGGSISHDEGRFPASALMLTDDELMELRKKVKKEEAEEERRLRRAQEAVRKEREEEADRIEYARLAAKFGGRSV
jgi:hypothetical protein